MSFSQDVKEELLNCDIRRSCCKLAEAYGLLLYGHKFSEQGIVVQSESEKLIQRYLRIFRRVGVHPSVKISQTLVEGKRAVNVLSVHEPSEIEKVHQYFLDRESAVSQNDCCRVSFLRGAFLACGTVTTGKNGYHLEFSASSGSRISFLENALSDCGFLPKRIERAGDPVLYYKNSDTIEELLTAIGATNAALRLMGVTIYKNIRNKANRITNCETANISRTVDAAGRQVDAIEYVRQKIGLDLLPKELKKVALVRLANPEASLNELCAMMAEEVSRSGMNHRLARIVRFADELKSKD